MASGADIRETFGRMAMNDEETVALVVGGHAFGKTDGAGAESRTGPRARGCTDGAAAHWLEEQLRDRRGCAHHDQRFRGGLTSTPTKWDNKYLETLMDNDWVLTESPAGHKQWTAPARARTVPTPTTRTSRTRR